MIELSGFQTAIVNAPESFNICLPGGKGGGKSFGAAVRVIEHCKRYQSDARVLIVRRTRDALAELFRTMATLILHEDPKRQANRQSLEINCFGGANIVFSQLLDPGSYDKLAGQSRTLIWVDEAGQYPDFRLIKRLSGDLRSGAGVPCSMIMAANPGGRGHHLIFKDHIRDRVAGQPYEVDGQTWITLPSTHLDNPHLPHNYELTLRASAGGNEALERQIIDGDWYVSAGHAFTKYSPSIHIHNIQPDYAQLLVNQRYVQPAIATDWGTVAPSVSLLGLICLRPIPIPLGDEHVDVFSVKASRLAPTGSLIVLDEVTDLMKDPEMLNLQRSLQWAPAQLAEKTAAMGEKWLPNRKLPLVIDDFKNADQTTLVSIFHETKLFQHVAKPVKPSRVARWG